MSKNTKKIYKKRQYSLKSKKNRRIRVRGKSKSRTKSHGGTRGGGLWPFNNSNKEKSLALAKETERIKNLKKNAQSERRENPYTIHQDVGWNGREYISNKKTINSTPYVRKLAYKPGFINESEYIIIKNGNNNIRVYGPDAEKILDVGYILERLNKCSTWYIQDRDCYDCPSEKHIGTSVKQIDDHTYDNRSEIVIGKIFDDTVCVTTIDQGKKYQTYYFYENSEFVNNPTRPTAFAMYEFDETKDNHPIGAVKNTDNADYFLSCS